MTAKEFFEYCKSKGWENKNVCIKHRDDEGFSLRYDSLGDDFEIYLDNDGDVII